MKGWFMRFMSLWELPFACTTIGWLCCCIVILRGYGDTRSNDWGIQ